MSDTPRTDTAISGGYRFTTDDGVREYIPATFARELERENSRLRSALEEIADSHDSPHNDQVARDALANKQVSNAPQSVPPTL